MNDEDGLVVFFFGNKDGLVVINAKMYPSRYKSIFQLEDSTAKGNENDNCTIFSF